MTDRDDPGVRREHGTDPPVPARPLSITIDTTRFIVILVLVMLAAEMFVVWLDYYFNYANGFSSRALRRMVNITREDGVASWLSVTQTAFVALTLWLIFVVSRKQQVSQWRRIGWAVLASFFTYMSLDDGSKMHERVGTALRSKVQEVDVGADTWVSKLMDLFPSYSWQFFLLPLFGAFGLFALVFLWATLETRRARVMMALAICLLVFAVGLDFAEGLEENHPFNPYVWLNDTFELDLWAWKSFDETGYTALVHFSKAIEEFAEMLGTTILWSLFLAHLARKTGWIELRFVNWPGRSGS